MFMDSSEMHILSCIRSAVSTRVCLFSTFLPQPSWSHLGPWNGFCNTKVWQNFFLPALLTYLGSWYMFLILGCRVQCQENKKRRLWMICLLFSDIHQFVFIRSSEHKNKTCGKQNKSRHISVWQFLVVIWSNCGEFWRNEVQNTPSIPLTIARSITESH